MVQYDVVLQFSGDGVIFMCQPVEVMLRQGDDTASSDAGPFGLEENLSSGIVCDSMYRCIYVYFKSY